MENLFTKKNGLESNKHCPYLSKQNYNKMKNKNLFLCLLLIASSLITYSQDKSEDVVLEAAKEFMDKMIGKWETYDMKKDYIGNSGEGTANKVEIEVRKIPNSIGIRATGKSFLMRDGKEEIVEGNTMYLYNRKDQDIRYIWWNETGASAEYTLKFAGDKWITYAPKFIEITQFEGDEILDEIYTYDENGHYQGSAKYKWRKMK